MTASYGVVIILANGLEVLPARRWNDPRALMQGAMEHGYLEVRPSAASGGAVFTLGLVPLSSILMIAERPRPAPPPLPEEEEDDPDEILIP